ncbi:porin [Grimontia kaedaensis]|uniref:Porin n=1 Tax=Grimontia kaedaensis TaxID=2872157 RepID=A0ABY4X173_9GAMM|nr:porin [Grimontia kaedaensis]USH04997.1 porin [Grimontia kaedaensis]
MKKTLLAVAIPAVLLAGNVNAFEAYSGDAGSVEIYGQLRATLAKSPDKDVTLNDGSSRAGVNALYSVTDDVDVFAKLEYSISYDKDAMANRLGYFGFTGDFGKVTLGKQYLTADDLWGVDNSYWFGGSHIVEGAVSGGKHDSAIRYILETDFATIDASYGLPEDGAAAEVAELFISKDIAGFSFTAGVSSAEQEHGAFDYKVNDSTTLKVSSGSVDDLYYTLWAERSFGDLTVGVQYANSSIESSALAVDLDREGYTLALNYGLSDKSAVYGGYEYSEVELSADEVSASAKDDYTNVYVGAVHKFNSYFRLWAEMGYSDGVTAGYSNNKNDGFSVAPSSVDSEAKYAIGARVYW